MVKGEVRMKTIKLIEELRGFLAEYKSDLRGTDSLEYANMAIEALEKQTAKKPITNYFDQYDDEFLCCPNCKEILTDRIPGDPKTFYFHCLNCGQKLDWD